MYYNDIDKYIKNIFDSSSSITTLKKLPDGGSLDSIEKNKLYKIQFVAIAVDVVGFKQLNKYTDPTVLHQIMAAFTSGVTKIMKEFKGQNIDIQGDGIYGIFPGDTKKSIDDSFSCACALNTFQNHINKLIRKNFPHKLKSGTDYYGSTEVSFDFGIGVWFSFDNYVARVGHGGTNDLIFMGKSVNNANLLAKQANRNGIDNILFNNLVESNFTEDKKSEHVKIGAYNKINIPELNVSVSGCNWVKTSYSAFVKNNV